MFEVTDEALGYLSEALSRAESIDADNDCFRMVVTNEDKVALSVQQPESGDHTFEREGSTILAMPEALSEALSERLLDLGDNGELVFLPKPS